MNFWTELREGLRISWDAIRANKLRSGLTTLGIIIGIVTVTLMATALAGLNTAFINSISQMGSDVLFVDRFPWASDEPWWMFRNRRELLYRDAKRVEKMMGSAQAVGAESFRRRSVTFNLRSVANVQVVGCTEESSRISGLTLKQGRFLLESEVGGGRPKCVLGADLASNLFGEDDPIGKKVKVEGGVTLEVVGVVEKMGKFLFGNLDNRLFMPITRFQGEVASWPGVLILVKVKDPTQMEEAREELRGIMRLLRRLPPGKPDDFSINQQQQIVEMFNRVGSKIASVGLFITGLSLFVGGIGIMNIMFVSVAERTREIGIRKAIGAKRRTILIQFLSEAAMICLLGGFLALAIALPLTLLMNRFLPATMSWSVAGLALVVSALTGIIAGFLPAYRAARMDPVEALRQE